MNRMPFMVSSRGYRTMKKYLYLALLAFPALSHAMEKKKPKTPEPTYVDLRVASKSSSVGRRSSLPNIFSIGFFKKKSSDISNNSSGSLDTRSLDNASVESATSPRASTPRSDGTFRGNQLTRSSNGPMSPEDDSSPVSHSGQYYIDPESLKMDVGEDDTSPKNLSDPYEEDNIKAVTTQSQRQVDLIVTGAVRYAQKVKYGAAQATALYRIAIPEASDEGQYRFPSQNSKHGDDGDKYLD